MLNFDPALETRILKTLLDEKVGSLLTTLNAEWFGMPVAQEIWARIDTLRKHGKPIPHSQTLSTDPVLSEKAQTLLRGVTRPFAETEMESAVDQMDQMRKTRIVLNMIVNVNKTMTGNTADLNAVQIEIQQCIQKMQTASLDEEILTYGPNPERALEIYEAAMNADLKDKVIPTGFGVIDAQQGGLARGRVYTIGAPSGGGKSTLANCMAANIYRKSSHSVGYYSFEMNREECMLRTQAFITRIPSDRFQLRRLSPDERKKSDRMFAQFLAHGGKNDCRLDYHCPGRDINIAQVFAEAENSNYDVVIIDYINLMASLDPKKPMWENIGEAFRLAKRWAEKTQKVVIMLVQIDEDTGNIKYAKSIRHHSDGVWTWAWGDQEKETGLVTVKQTKLRNLKPIDFELQAEFEYCSFAESPAGSVSQVTAAKPMNLNP